MRDRSGMSNSFLHLFPFAHRATAAFRAVCARCFAVSFRARAFPPFKPPSPAQGHRRRVLFRLRHARLMPQSRATGKPLMVEQLEASSCF